MKKIFLALLLCIGLQQAGAQSLNSYQYVLVPSKFPFQKEANEHHLNLLLKLHLQKAGFQAYLDTDEIPQEMKPMCARLVVDVSERSTIFITELQVRIKNCMGETLHETPTGKSRLKDFNASTRQAVAQAFQDFSEQIHYQYNGNNGEMNKFREELVGSSAPVAKQEVVQPSTINKQETETNLTAPASESKGTTYRDWWVMYAEAQPNGYRLTDKQGTKEVILRKTSQPTLFQARYEGQSGTFLQKDGQWILEYYDDKDVLHEVLIVVNLE